MNGRDGASVPDTENDSVRAEPDDGTMTAIEIAGGSGPASALRPTRVPIPEAGDGEVLIRVRAAGINMPDLFQRKGAYPPPPGAPETLGLEVSGTVVRAAGRWHVGDAVCALLGGGGYAEYVACDARHVLPRPVSLDFVSAACLPETTFTVYANVFESARLVAGETLLVHGATSGIGLSAIAMGKAARARVIATARGAEKAAFARAFGADIAIDATRENFAEVARAAGGVDVVLEMVGGGDYFAKDLEALNLLGRIVFIASLGGDDVRLQISQLMTKRAIVMGARLRGRSADEKARLAEAIERVVWPWIAAGKVTPRIDRAFPLEEAAEAHAYLERGSHVGKVVLIVQS